MKRTKHFTQRANQRGIKQVMVDLALDFGKQQGKKIILNKKEAQAVLVELDGIRKNIIRVLDKKGIVVISDNDALVSVYSISV